MFKYLVLLFFVSARVWGRLSDDAEPLVVKGTPAKDGQYPFAATIRKAEDLSLYCGGAIISEYHILTAAHCIKPGGPTNHPSLIFVGVGSVDVKKQTLMEAANFTINPDYITSRGFHDIGLIRLKEPLKFDKYIQPIHFTYINELTGKNATAMGWGRTHANEGHAPILLHINSTMISREECQERYKKKRIVIGVGDLCYGTPFGTGLCMGDSGSPLLYHEYGVNYIVGTMSRTVPCATSYPEIFTRVPHYIDWIRKNMI